MITRAHRRSLNRAIHELRRPLQALVLLEDGSGQPAASRPGASRRGLMEVAVAALEDLDRAVNGGPAERPVRRFSCREVVMGCLERWRPLAADSGGFRVYWDAGPAMVDGDPARLAQAIDNLIANALEHGTPPLVVTGASVAGKLRLTVANRAAAPAPVRTNGNGDRTADADPRRGHGTEVVSRTAGEHDGRFVLCHTQSGCVAALELPLADRRYAHAA